MNIQQPLSSKNELEKSGDKGSAALNKHWNGKMYYHRLLGMLLKRIVPEQKRILDLGCGTGDLLSLLKPSYGVGLDINADAIGAAQEKYPHLTWVVADIEALDSTKEFISKTPCAVIPAKAGIQCFQGILDCPIKSGNDNEGGFSNDRIIKVESFDYILLVNTIGFIRDIQAVLSRLKRFVGPETKIVIIHYNYLWEPLLKLAERLGLKAREPYLNWLSIADIENLLCLEGFEATEKGQHILMPMRIPLISGLLNRFVVNCPFFWRFGLVESVVARRAPVDTAAVSCSCSVVVPARNERGTIEALVRRLPSMGNHTEILFVEGHSTDGTLEEMLRVQALCPDRDIKILVQDGDGKADAVRKGFAQAKGDVLIILDADMTVSPEDIEKFYSAVSSGKGELAIGSRLVYQLQDESMRFFNLIANKFFGLAFSYILGQRIKDTLCGTKALRKKYYREIEKNRPFFGDLDPFGDFDLIFGAKKANLKILEIPVRYHARQYGTTQISRFRHGLLLFRMVWLGLRKLKFT